MEFVENPRHYYQFKFSGLLQTLDCNHICIWNSNLLVPPHWKCHKLANFDFDCWDSAVLQNNLRHSEIWKNIWQQVCIICYIIGQYVHSNQPIWQGPWRPFDDILQGNQTTLWASALLWSIEGGVLIGIKCKIRSRVFIWSPFDLI